MNIYTLFNPVRENQEFVKKISLVMKLITLFITIACLQVCAAGFGQQVTLKKNHVTLENLFDEIQKQTGYIVFYESNLLDNNFYVDVNVNHAELKDILNEYLKGTSLTYSIVDKTIVIRKKPASENKGKRGVGPAVTNIAGTVLDSLGNPLPNATVELNNLNVSRNSQSKTGVTSAGTTDQRSSAATGPDFTITTDSLGKFKIVDMPDGKYLLNIGYVGYARYKKEITLNNKPIYLRIVLESRKSQLDEIQIIAYGPAATSG